jgi:ribA/ribD-fused uncharacterized protein
MMENTPIARKRKSRPDVKSGISPEEKIMKKMDCGRDDTMDEEVNDVMSDNGDNGDSGDSEADSDISLVKHVDNIECCRILDETIRSMDIDDESKTAQNTSNIGEIHKKLCDVIKAINFVSETVEDLKKDLKNMEKVLQKQEQLEKQFTGLKQENDELKEKINAMENYSRRENIEISGVTETNGESAKEICTKIFSEKLGISDPIEIVRCHRIGITDKTTSQKPRKILARLAKYTDKEEIMKNKKKLKGTGIFINDNLTTKSQQRQTALAPILKKLRETDPKAHFRGDKIFSKGRLYSENKISTLPIDPHQACTRTENGVTVFAGKYSKLSNLSRCNINLDGQSWVSVEHYVQYQKAIAHGEPQIAAQIATTEDPYEAMALGNRIKAENAWHNEAEAAMNKALQVKFKLPAFKTALQQAGEVLGESTTNKQWGTGLNLGHVNACKQNMWIGKNSTGKLLMNIKSKF